jgi:hypothetical protein
MVEVEEIAEHEPPLTAAGRAVHRIRDVQCGIECTFLLEYLERSRALMAGLPTGADAEAGSPHAQNGVELVSKRRVA